MIVLLVGGSKSGKSMLGQDLSIRLNEKDRNPYYLATMRAFDDEDLKRIENHILDRKGLGFKTIEQEKDLDMIIDKFKKDETILLDSLTSLVVNEMFKGDKFIESVSFKILNDIKSLAKKVKNLIIVTDYLFSDAIIYDDYTDIYKREIGKLNIEIAKISDIVIESSFSNKIIHKGKELMEDLL